MSAKPSQKITAVQALFAVMQHVLFHVHQIMIMVSSAHKFGVFLERIRLVISKAGKSTSLEHATLHCLHCV